MSIVEANEDLAMVRRGLHVLAMMLVAYGIPLGLNARDCTCGTRGSERLLIDGPMADVGFPRPDLVGGLTTRS